MSFKDEVRDRLNKNRQDISLRKKAHNFFLASLSANYSYNFEWLSRPIIQYPQDIMAMQEIIWEVRPDLIIETGIAHGGSIIFSASMLALMDLFEVIETNEETMNPRRSGRKVLGIDIEIRPHNRAAIERHPMYSRIQMIEGSSIDAQVIEQVYDIARHYEKVMVFLDSMHTHDHVLAELEAYAPLVSLDSYCVVFDTIIEDMPANVFPDRPWGPGNNPKTAVWDYLKKLEKVKYLGIDGKPLNLQVDNIFENKMLITVAPDGYLKRTE
jgi:cephalosporin hydroxylase